MSPHRRTVEIADVVWGEVAPYIVLRGGNVSLPITISGWSIRNERGERIEIGEGVEDVQLGRTQELSPITLGTGTPVILSFTPSPIGVSFLENACTGYLEGTRELVPKPAYACPDVTEHHEFFSLDETCKSLVASLPKCRAVSPEHLAQVSTQCSSFLVRIPTYTSCTREKNTNTHTQWRVFLDHPSFILKEKGMIYLFDDRGLLVDALEFTLAPASD